MEAWLIWLVFAVVLGIAEIFTLTAALGLLGGAALITAGSAAIGLPLAAQFLVFTVASAVGVVLVRPIARRHMFKPQVHRFGVDALIGKSAYVVQEVTGREGRVRVDGEEWTARAYDDAVVIPSGTVVDVMQISGATALVYPLEGPWKSQPR